MTPGTTYPVLVGAGGAGPTSNGNKGGNGGNSQFNNLVAIGGGAGGTENSASDRNGTLIFLKVRLRDLSSIK